MQTLTIFGGQNEIFCYKIDENIDIYPLCHVILTINQSYERKKLEKVIRSPGVPFNEK